MDFQPEKESWQLYAERLDHFFTTTKVVEDDQKVAALIVANDPSFHTLLRDLSFPINPKTMTYSDVMFTLERHYVGVKNIFRERKLFYSAVLEPSENASEWYRRLKSLAIDCKFGDLLEEVLVDRFVCGFEGKIFHSLCEEDANLNLVRALKKAQLHEKDLNVHNESIEDLYVEGYIESDEVSEDKSDEEDILEDDHQPFDIEIQEKDGKQEEKSIQESTQSLSHEKLQMLPTQASSLPNFIDFNDLLFLPHRTVTSIVAPQKQYRRVSPQKPHLQPKKVNNQQQKQVQKEGNHQKQKTVQKQNNQQRIEKQENHHQKQGSVMQQLSQPQKHQPNNTKQNQPNQKPFKSLHQQSNNKPSVSSSQKLPTPHKKPQQSRSQQQSVPKSVNHQQKSQTLQKTTIITKTETITTKTTTKTAPKPNPKKLPTLTKSHK